MKRTVKFTALLAAAALLTGCAQTPANEQEQAPDNGMVQQSTAEAEQTGTAEEAQTDTAAEITEPATPSMTDEWKDAYAAVLREKRYLDDYQAAGMDLTDDAHYAFMLLDMEDSGVPSLLVETNTGDCLLYDVQDGEARFLRLVETGSVMFDFAYRPGMGQIAGICGRPNGGGEYSVRVSDVHGGPIYDVKFDNFPDAEHMEIYGLTESNEILGEEWVHVPSPDYAEDGMQWHACTDEEFAGAF